MPALSMQAHPEPFRWLFLQNLDFDFEKCCSISLSPVNVYACLVCGKYFQVPSPCRLACPCGSGLLLEGPWSCVLTD